MLVKHFKQVVLRTARYVHWKMSTTVSLDAKNDVIHRPGQPGPVDVSVVYFNVRQLYWRFITRDEGDVMEILSHA